MHRLGQRTFALRAATPRGRGCRQSWIHRFHQRAAISAQAETQAAKALGADNSSTAQTTHTSTSGQKLTLLFGDRPYTFHAQWLYDARCDLGTSKPAEHAFCNATQIVSIQDAFVSEYNQTSKTQSLCVTWQDGTKSEYPMPWIEVMAPIVGKTLTTPSDMPGPNNAKGWLAGELNIPSVAYSDLITAERSTSDEVAHKKLKIIDELLQDFASGLIKVEGLPRPNMEDERNKENTLVTKILKGLFGKVFDHPTRGKDKTFNVASHHHDDTKRGVGLPNYDTNQVLLPHGDHAHYQHPIRVQGWYGLEGESENTFVSAIAAMRTMEAEAPELVPLLSQVPMALGRVAHYYQPPMYQGVVDTPVTYRNVGSVQQIYKIRWHPHLTSSLLASFEDFERARLAHQTFQEILRRDTHQIKIKLEPGDMYIWDNYRVLHGRERVLKLPRTGVGQTVPDQVVADRYRSLCIAQLRDYIDESWLIALPNEQLFQLRQLLNARHH